MVIKTVDEEKKRQRERVRLHRDTEIQSEST
jgi:hypothetical protein